MSHHPNTQAAYRTTRITSRNGSCRIPSLTLRWLRQGGALVLIFVFLFPGAYPASLGFAHMSAMKQKAVSRLKPFWS